MSTGLTEPILKRDASFYMFILPFYKEMITFFIVVFIISIASLLLSLYSQDNMSGKRSYEEINILGVKIGRSVVIAGSLLFVDLALQKFIARYDLLFFDWGSVSGPCWTDVKVRLPVYLITALLTLLTVLAFILPTVRRRLISYIKRYQIQPYTVLFIKNE